MLTFAAILCFLLGLAHSVLGERYILIRLFRGESLPALFGDDRFTRQTLRFAWHVTSVMAFGFGVPLLITDSPDVDPAGSLLLVVAVTFSICGLLALAFTRARHLSWLVFFSVAVLAFLAAR